MPDLEMQGDARQRLLMDLASRINRSKYPLFTRAELKSKTHLSEEEWYQRTCRFLEDPSNGFPNTGLVRDLVRGLLTERFAAQLGSQTVAKYAPAAKGFPAPKKYKGT